MREGVPDTGWGSDDGRSILAQGQSLSWITYTFVWGVVGLFRPNQIRIIVSKRDGNLRSAQ
jgi:hypothetical protein